MGDPINSELNILRLRDLEIDLNSKRVFVNKIEKTLPIKEFILLEILVKNPNKIYSRESLLKSVWGENYLGDARTVDVHIRRLREKIEPNPSDPIYIFTRWGAGYYFKK